MLELAPLDGSLKELISLCGLMDARMSESDIEALFHIANFIFIGNQHSCILIPTLNIHKYTFTELLVDSNFPPVFWLQMIRVKDPKVSLDFYSRIMGMT